ncbi:carboxymuconolactone decarboxylase family protein [Legionella lytica]|uniref:Alkyl hydroperoxide reductase AhpD n=1 Tax=Legionella lytica TaxID=96232 RepID=A0ABW8D8C0_9GAMM
MSIEELKQSIPDYAKDIRLNLSNLFGNIVQTALTERQFYGVSLAIAYSLKNKQILEAILAEGETHITSELHQAAKIAATLMAMNNVYYRAIHLAGNKELSLLPANLRMNAMANPGVPKADFELFALAVSALNGCGMCIHSHVAQLSEEGISMLAIQASLRIAAVLNAAALALTLE